MNAFRFSLMLIFFHGMGVGAAWGCAYCTISHDECTATQTVCTSYGQQCTSYSNYCTSYHDVCDSYEDVCDQYDENGSCVSDHEVCTSYSQECGSYGQQCDNYEPYCASYGTECTQYQTVCDTYSYGDTVTVSGKVKAAANNAAVANSSITVTNADGGGATTTADGNGNYSVQFFAYDDAQKRFNLKICSGGSSTLLSQCQTISQPDACSAPVYGANFSLANATIPFFVANSKPDWSGVYANNSPARFFTGDFNGDGKTDLAFLYSDGNSFIGFSDGTRINWQYAGTVSDWGSAVFAPSSPARFFTGDFNGDGKTDLAFAYPDGNVFFGYSDGSRFVWRLAGSKPDWGRSVFAPGSPAHFFTGDFNGDGKTDLAFTYPDGNVFFGYSDGTRIVWQLASSKPEWGNSVFAGNSPARFFSGDFNGDGKTDLALTYPDGNLFFGISDGTYLHWILANSKPDWGAGVYAPGSPARFFVGDFNGDGKADLAMLYADGNAFLGISDGAHVQWQAAGSKPDWGTTVFAALSSARFFVGDFNGDGKADLAFTFPDGNLFVGISNGQRFTWLLTNSFPTWGSSVYDASSPARFFSGDFNGDRKSDIVFTFPDGNILMGTSLVQ